jgi:hypothetical protein
MDTYPCRDCKGIFPITTEYFPPYVLDYILKPIPEFDSTGRPYKSRGITRKDKGKRIKRYRARCRPCLNKRDNTAYRKRRMAAGLKVYEEPFFDKEMNLYACTCPNCKGEMLWPKEFFAPPSPVHYRKIPNSERTRHGGILKRGCLHRTITCLSQIAWKKYEESIEWYMYLRWRSIAKSQDGLEISKLEKGSRKKKIENDIIFNNDFLPLFESLDKDEDGHYICPVFEKTMRRVHGTGPRGWGPDDIGPPSIDRIDSTKPHTLDNIQIISWRANDIKMNATLEELIMVGEWAETLMADIEYHRETFIY